MVEGIQIFLQSSIAEFVLALKKRGETVVMATIIERPNSETRPRPENFDPPSSYFGMIQVLVQTNSMVDKNIAAEKENNRTPLRQKTLI